MTVTMMIVGSAQFFQCGHLLYVTNTTSMSLVSLSYICDLRVIFGQVNCDDLLLIFC